MWVCICQFHSLENSYIFQVLKVIWNAVSLKHALSIRDISWGTYISGWILWWTASIFPAPNLPCFESFSSQPLPLQPWDPSKDCHLLFVWRPWWQVMDLQVCLSGLRWNRTGKWQLVNLVIGAGRCKAWHHWPRVLCHVQDVALQWWRVKPQAERRNTTKIGESRSSAGIWRLYEIN